MKVTFLYAVLESVQHFDLDSLLAGMLLQLVHYYIEHDNNLNFLLRGPYYPPPPSTLHVVLLQRCRPSAAMAANTDPTYCIYLYSCISPCISQDPSVDYTVPLNSCCCCQSLAWWSAV